MMLDLGIVGVNTLLDDQILTLWVQPRLMTCATVEGAVAEVVRMLVGGRGSYQPAELGV